MTNKSFSGDRSVAFGLPSPPPPPSRRRDIYSYAETAFPFIENYFCLLPPFLSFFSILFSVRVYYFFFNLFFIGIGFHCPSWWGRGEGCRMVSSSFDFDFALVCLMLQFDIFFSPAIIRSFGLDAVIHSSLEEDGIEMHNST